MASDLKRTLTKNYIGLQLWVLIVIALGVVFVVILGISLWLTFRKKSRNASRGLPVSQYPLVSEEIKEIRVDQASANNGSFPAIQDKYNEGEQDQMLIPKAANSDDSVKSGPFTNLDKAAVLSGEEGDNRSAPAHQHSSHPVTAPSPLIGLPEFSQLGWGHWFTLRDLQLATNRFSKENIIGDGGYGVVYRGHLVNGTPVAVKKLLNNP